MFKKIRDGLKYAFYIVSHPIQGFYEMRFEGQGNLYSAILVLALLVVSFIFQKQYTGFIFNRLNLKEFNVIKEIINVVVTVLLWCTANWSITTLIDGEGRFIDIFMASAYATLPYSITSLIAVLLSRVMTSDEGTLIGLITGIGLFVSAFLVFTGIMTIHQFTVKRTIVSILLTVFGMAFIMFLAILFAGVFDKMFRYILGIITEIQLRM